MDYTTNLSPIELQLRKENKDLKKQMRELEEIFTAADEKSLQENQILRQTEKELKEQIEHLRNKIFDIESLYSSSPSSSPSPCLLKYLPSSYFNPTNPSSPLPSTEYEHETTVDKSCDDSSFSLSDAYANLQESYQSLEAENSELHVKVKSLEVLIKDLRFKEYRQEDFTEELKSRNFQLCQENEELKASIFELSQEKDELYKTVGRLQRKLDEIKISTVNESQISLFDELEEARKKEEEEEEEAILPIVVENNAISEKQSIDKTITNDVKILKKKRNSVVVTKKSSDCWFTVKFIFFLLSMFCCYIAVCVRFDIPLLFFVSPENFNYKLQ